MTRFRPDCSDAATEIFCQRAIFPEGWDAP
jgi:hypothetical protein